VSVDGAAERLRALADRVGEIEYVPQTFTVSEQDIAKFASAIGATDPEYFDAQAAHGGGLRGIVAPRAFYISLGTTRGRLIPRSAYSADGLPSEEQLHGSRLVVGGSVAEFFDDIYAGDRVTVEQKVVAVAARDGRSGPLLIIELERRYVRGDGATLVVETITRIVR
jgi:hypothetical protein